MCTLAYKGCQRRLSAEALEKLDERCSEGFSSLQSAVQWVEATFRVSYTPQGLWTLFQRLGYKAKIGRPQHYKQDLEAQAAFKKNFNLKATL